MIKSLLAFAQKSKREEGQGLVEYALILVLVAVVVIVILSVLGPLIGNIFSAVTSTLQGNLPGQTTGPTVCIGDGAPPVEYYLFVNGADTINAPAQSYQNSGCTTPGTVFNIMVIKGSLPVATANQKCQTAYGVNANLNGGIYYCP